MSKSLARYVIYNNSKIPKQSNFLRILVSFLGLSKALSGSGIDLQKDVCNIAGVHEHVICMEGKHIAFIRS